MKGTLSGKLVKVEAIIPEREREGERGREREREREGERNTVNHEYFMSNIVYAIILNNFWTNNPVLHIVNIAHVFSCV